MARDMESHIADLRQRRSEAEGSEKDAARQHKKTG